MLLCLVLWKQATEVMSFSSAIQQEERRTQPAVPSQQVQLSSRYSAPLFPPKMPFNLAHCHPVQALCDCRLLSSYECGSGEGVDSGLEASEAH